MIAPQTIRTQHWLMLLGLSLTWGSSFVAIDVARQDFTPFAIAFLRLAIGALILLVFLTLTGRRLPRPNNRENRRFWRFAILMGLLSNAFPFTAISWAQAYVPSSFAGLTMATVPLVVLPLAHIFIPSERLTRRKIFGFAIGFIGSVVLIDPFDNGMLTIGLPEWALIASAASYATGGIVTRFAPQDAPVRLAAGALLAGTLMVLPFFLGFGGLSTPIAPRAMIGVVHLGVFSTGLATIFIVIVVREAGPSFLSLSNYLVPVWAVILGAVLLDETIPARFYVALALILAGIIIARNRTNKKRRHLL